MCTIYFYLNGDLSLRLFPPFEDNLSNITHVVHAHETTSTSNLSAPRYDKICVLIHCKLIQQERKSVSRKF